MRNCRDGRRSVVPIADWLVGPGLRRMVWVLLGAVGLLLALACANIAGLLMTRVAGSPGRKWACALALGAERAAPDPPAG